MLVLPFIRTNTTMTPVFSLFGKIPNRADFLRINSTHPAATELDCLIQRGFERIVVEQNWENGYRENESVDFQFVSSDKRHVMVGVLKPSNDQCGRCYPLVAAAILPSESVRGYACILPIAYEVFYSGLREQVANAVENSVEALSCRQYLEASLRLHDTDATDLELAQSVVARFLESRTVGYLRRILMDGIRSTTLEQALLNLVFYQSYLRRFDNPITNQVVLLPLSSSRGEQALVACVWLTIMSSLFSGGEMHKRMNDSHGIMRKSSGDALLVYGLGNIQEKVGSIMLGGASSDPAVTLDLSTEHEAWTSHRMYAEVSYALGRLLSNQELPLVTLMAFMRDIGCKLD
jgi:type VI secretion system protein ImpM